MKITISYVVDESNRRQGVQISYDEWKQLKQRLFDAEMQFWEIQRLEAIIRQTDLAVAIPVVKLIEAGKAPAITLTDAFTEELAVSKQKSNPYLVVLPSFIEKVNLLLQKYPVLPAELVKINQEQLGGFASTLNKEYISFGWQIVRKKTRQQPAMRIEIYLIHKSDLPDTVSQEPLYLAAIYDKSDQKLVQPEPLELL